MNKRISVNIINIITKYIGFVKNISFNIPLYEKFFLKKIK